MKKPTTLEFCLVSGLGWSEKHIWSMERLGACGRTLMNRHRVLEFKGFRVHGLTVLMETCFFFLGGGVMGLRVRVLGSRERSFLPCVAFGAGLASV